MVRANPRMIRRYGLIVFAFLCPIGVESEVASKSPKQFSDDKPIDKRQRNKERRVYIEESTGSITWEGIDDDRLPATRTRKRRTHRKLESSTQETTAPSTSPNVFQTFDSYGIGGTDYSVSAAKSAKSSTPKPSARPVTRPTSPPVIRYIPTAKPNSSPTRKPTRRPTPAPTLGSSCFVEMQIDFLQLSAIPPAIFVDASDADEQALGTRYVYNDGLRDQDSLDELTNSKGSGTCTRIQARIGNENIGLQLGGGHCVFEYSLTDSQDREIVFTASGNVFDSIGGVLSITGGSQSALGAYGEIELLPVNLLVGGNFEVETGDFFLDPLFYLADATLYVPCA